MLVDAVSGQTRAKQGQTLRRDVLLVRGAAGIAD
jgi:hypothetical protein